MKNHIYKTEGIVIKKADLGETDRLLTIYTKEYGKMQIRAKSARKIESKLKGFLELFTYSRFLLAKSKTIDIIIDVEPIDAFASLHVSLNFLQRAFQISGLIDQLIAGQEPDQQLWQFILRTFQDLNSAIPPQDFEENLLENLGYGNLAERNGQKAIDFIRDRLNF